MVTKSIVNYEQHKMDIFNAIAKRYGEKRAKKFIDVYSSRFDKPGRSFIDYKLAYWLMDDLAYVNRIGTKWYACVGVGGTGKTTIMKNMFYFLDPTFDIKRTTTSIDGFIRILNDIPTVGAKCAVLMDEPDDDVSHQSKKGKILRKIFGKIRQQQLYIGICATDLKDIPPYMFRKLDGIIFCQALGKFMFFKNRPNKGSYPIQRIRDEYTKLGYKVFFKLRKSAGCLCGDTGPRTPFDINMERKYLNNKEADFKGDIKDYLVHAQPESKEAEINLRDKIIVKMKKKKLKDQEIADLLDLSRQRIQQIVAKYANASA